MKFCFRCGSQISEDAVTCPKCGTAQVQTVPPTPPPFAPAVMPSAGSKKLPLGVAFAAAYCLVTTLFSAGFLIWAAVRGIHFRQEQIITSLGFNILNILVTIYLTIGLLLRHKVAQIGFYVWGVLFFLSQYWFVLPALLYPGLIRAFYLRFFWVGANLLLYILFAVILSVKNKAFKH